MLSRPKRAITYVLACLLAQSAVWAVPVEVVVSILPLKNFVENIGGPEVSVSTMVGTGHSPATYEPTPKQLTAMADARVYFRIGVPFENAWMDRIAALYPRLPIINCRYSKTNELDPHVWTSPLNVAVIAVCIRDALIAVAPTQVDLFEQRHRQFAASLAGLDTDIRRRLHESDAHEFLVFHPAWGHFAAEYGLQQIALEHAGKQPGARMLTRLIDHAGKRRLKVILVQPQFSRSLAEVAAKELHARLVEVDPLAEDYLAAMEALTLAVTMTSGP